MLKKADILTRSAPALGSTELAEVQDTPLRKATAASKKANRTFCSIVC